MGVGPYFKSWTGQCEKVVLQTTATVVELTFYFSSLELKVMKTGRGSLTGQHDSEFCPVCTCFYKPKLVSFILSSLSRGVELGQRELNPDCWFFPDKNTSLNKTRVHMCAGAACIIAADRN